MANGPSEGTRCVMATIGHTMRTLETFIHLRQTYEVNVSKAQVTLVSAVAKTSAGA